MTTEWHEPMMRIVGRWGLGLVAVTALIFLSTVPLRLAHLEGVRPAFMLMAVYYWSILRPAPPVAVFLIGLLLDLFSKYTFGLNAVTLVMTQMVTTGQRKFLLGQSFLVIWAGFALVALGAGLVQWAVFSLFDWTLVAIKPMLISTILSSCLFPVVVLPLAAVYKALAGPLSDVP